MQCESAQADELPLMKRADMPDEQYYLNIPFGRPRSLQIELTASFRFDRDHGLLKHHVTAGPKKDLVSMGIQPLPPWHDLDVMLNSLEERTAKLFSLLDTEIYNMDPF